MTTTQPLTLIDFGDTGFPTHESFSPFCIKAHRALNALGLSFEVRPITGHADMTRYNPKGQLPVMLVGEEPVPDSTEILLRAEKLAGKTLNGGSARIAAEARLWEEMADGALYGYVVASRWADEDNWIRTRAALFTGMPTLLRNLIANKVRKGVVERLVARDIWRGGPKECWARLDALLDDFEARAPETGFFLGPDLTRADIALFAQLHSFRTALTPVQQAMVERRPRLVSWLDRVDEATRDAAPKPRKPEATRDLSAQSMS